MVLIPVPTEGTIIMLVDKEGRMKVLIPVPTEGTIIYQYYYMLVIYCFNPRTHGGYDGEII